MAKQGSTLKELQQTAIQTLLSLRNQSFQKEKKLYDKFGMKINTFTELKKILSTREGYNNFLETMAEKCLGLYGVSNVLAVLNIFHHPDFAPLIYSTPLGTDTMAVITKGIFSYEKQRRTLGDWEEIFKKDPNHPVKFPTIQEVIDQLTSDISDSLLDSATGITAITKDKRLDDMKNAIMNHLKFTISNKYLSEQTRDRRGDSDLIQVTTKTSNKGKSTVTTSITGTVGDLEKSLNKLYNSQELTLANFYIGADSRKANDGSGVLKEKGGWQINIAIDFSEKTEEDKWFGITSNYISDTVKNILMEYDEEFKKNGIVIVPKTNTFFELHGSSMLDIQKTADKGDFEQIAKIFLINLRKICYYIKNKYKLKIDNIALNEIFKILYPRLVILVKRSFDKQQKQTPLSLIMQKYTILDLVSTHYLQKIKGDLGELLAALLLQNDDIDTGILGDFDFGTKSAATDNIAIIKKIGEKIGLQVKNYPSIYGTGKAILYEQSSQLLTQQRYLGSTNSVNLDASLEDSNEGTEENLFDTVSQTDLNKIVALFNQYGTLYINDNNISGLTNIEKQILNILYKNIGSYIRHIELGKSDSVYKKNQDSSNDNKNKMEPGVYKTIFNAFQDVTSNFYVINSRFIPASFILDRIAAQSINALKLINKPNLEQKGNYSFFMTDAKIEDFSIETSDFISQNIKNNILNLKQNSDNLVSFSDELPLNILGLLQENKNRVFLNFKGITIFINANKLGKEDSIKNLVTIN